MPDFLDSETMWLNITNAALGLVTLICLGVFVYGVVQEIKERVRRRVRVTADSHTFQLEQLGITMADGGELIDETSGQTRPGDPSNIVRSEE